MVRIPSGLLAVSLALSEAQANDHTRKLENTNHIFNAIHSSMRQWGSSLSPGHNGMSFFIATVPKGTQLYHGTNQADRVNGTQWLAFEPEHASVFARGRRGPPPGKGGPPPIPDDEEGSHPPERLGDPPPPPKHELKARHVQMEQPFTHTAAQRHAYHEEPEKPSSRGYLHTYRTNHDLRLLYIDGQSAAKSDKGTLDTQDIVLLHGVPPPSDGDHGPSRRHPDEGTMAKDKDPRPGGFMNESYRAENMCAMAEKEWKGKIDGFLRMEEGFEIILCSFKQDLDVERITRVREDGMGGPPGHSNALGSFSYYQAVASRFDGIGGNRVSINYDNFVTLFTHENALFFTEEGLPRARNDTAALKPVRKEIDAMILDDKGASTNWQAVADMVVARYADRIEALAEGAFEDLNSFKMHLLGAIRPFIDFGTRNTKAEVFRCATQYMPDLPPPDTLATNAILGVATTLCTQLLAADQQETLDDAVAVVRALKNWLGWPVFKRCRGCAANEVCFVPIWPFGSIEDMENPKCVSSMLDTGRGYWSGM